MAQRIDQLAEQCQMCGGKKGMMDEHASHLADLMNRNAAERYRYFDDTDTLLKHLRFDHHIYLKGFFPVSFAMVGFIIGVVVAALLLILLPVFHLGAKYTREGFLVLTLAGMLAGWFAGSIRERKLKHDQRILS
jgi:hypothetical protein